MRTTSRERVSLALSIILIALIVVPWRDLQDHAHWMTVRWVPFVSPPVKMLDLVGNVLLYMPFGYSYHRTRPTRPIWWTVAAAAGISIFTEWTQLYSHSRFPSTADIVCNLAGALAGAFLPERRRKVV